HCWPETPHTFPATPSPASKAPPHRRALPAPRAPRQAGTPAQSATTAQSAQMPPPSPPPPAPPQQFSSSSNGLACYARDLRCDYATQPPHRKLPSHRIPATFIIHVPFTLLASLHIPPLS